MSAPNVAEVAESEPSLAEAFGDLANALVQEDDGGGPEQYTAPTEESPTTTQQSAPSDTASSGQVQSGTQTSTQQDTATQTPEQADTEQTSVETPELQPLGYTVDGQARTFEGGYILPRQGAVISNDALPKLQDRLQQADRLVGTNQQLYAQVQDIQKLGGREAFERLSAQRAMLDACATTLVKAMGDERILQVLANDPIARQQLMKELSLIARETELTATRQFREQATRDQSAAQHQADSLATVSDIIGRMAPQYTGLLPEDVEVIRGQAARMLPAIIRPATPDEARIANPPVQPGQLILDAQLLHQMLNDRHTLRTAIIQQAQARQTAAQDNLARARAAAPTTVPNGNGARPTPRPGAGKPPTTETKTLDQLSAKEFNRAMKSGRIWDLVGEDDQQ